MFKVGEEAIVRDGGKKVKIVLVLREERAVKVTHVDGHEEILDESCLHPGHPTVLFTAAGRDAAQESNARHLEQLRAKPPAVSLNYALMDEVEDCIKAADLPLNLRGHWKNGGDEDDLEYFKSDIMSSLNMRLDEPTLRSVLEAVQTKTPLTQWVKVANRVLFGGCSYCGMKHMGAETNGVEIRLTGEECPLPNGFPLNEWELNVPSGELVVANDLRDLFSLPEGDQFDVNTVRGKRQTAIAYACVGMAHAYVGNSCPGVYRCKDGSYKIANPPATEFWDSTAQTWKTVKPKPKSIGKRLTGICTDLWWYSIVDHDEFKRRCEQLGVSPPPVDVIKVKPGVYRFRHDDEGGRGYGPEERVYSTFERVRKPDPVRDYQTQYEKVNVNASAYVQAMAKQWPTLYGVTRDGLREVAVPWTKMTEGEQLHAWQRVADQLFCTLGGGVEWHHKGFPKAVVDPKVPDVEPPTFRQQHYWYPFSDTYGGLWGPKKLSPSFAKLAFRVLESVISFGMAVNDGSHSRDVYGTRRRMLLAVRRYRELAVLYPDQADPDYVWWLGQEGRAEDWVENFPLGPIFTEKHRKHAASQRWVPEDAYAVEFDGRKIKDGYHTSGNGWARPEHAVGYSLTAWEDNKQPSETNCFWSVHAVKTMVPICSVARVVKLGEVSHMGETLVELAYDYGTPWMTDATRRKAIREVAEKDGIRILTKEEYESMLDKLKVEFETANQKDGEER